MKRGPWILSCLTLVLLPFSLAAAPESARPPKVFAIRAGRLIDGRGGAPVREAVILVTGDRITAVGAGLPIPADAVVVDLSGITVLPGLID